MNLNELFFYKTIPCNKKNKEHDFETCYYSHKTYNDYRRLQIGLTIVNNLDMYQDYEIIPTNILHYYIEEIGFENNSLNTLIFNKEPCKNIYEHKFHIMNYKT